MKHNGISMKSMIFYKTIDCAMLAVYDSVASGGRCFLCLLYPNVKHIYIYIPRVHRYTVHWYNAKRRSSVYRQKCCTYPRTYLQTRRLFLCSGAAHQHTIIKTTSIFVKLLFKKVSMHIGLELQARRPHIPLQLHTHTSHIPFRRHRFDRCL